MERLFGLFGVLLYAEFLAACGGAALTSPAREAAQSSRTVSCITSTCIYVTNPAVGLEPQVTIYPRKATGNKAPIRKIAGRKTQLFFPYGVAVASNRDIYVANGGGYGVLASITVYSGGSYGNVGPTRTIQGTHTGIGIAEGVALDSNDNIYVASFFPYTNGCSSPAKGSISVYQAGANGNVSPILVISGGIYYPDSVAVDAHGNVYAANTCDRGITVYAPGNSSYPIQTISGPSTGLTTPNGVAVDGNDNIYVSQGQSVLVFAAGSNGDVAPIQTISGSNTGLHAQGIALDSAGSVYVANPYEAPASRSVTVYASGSDGNAAPIQAIVGKRTKLTYPFGIAVQ